MSTATNAAVRKSTGTRSMSDVLLSLLRIRTLQKGDDVADYEAGVLIKVSCLLKDSRMPHRPGHLYLGRDEPIVWRSVRGSREIPLPRPVALRPANDRNAWPMGEFLLGGYEVRVPLADVAFLEHALRARAA